MPAQPEALDVVASLLHLMTCEARGACPRRAHLILRELQALDAWPADTLPPLLRDVCRRLVLEWVDIVYSDAKAVRGGPAPVAH